MPKIEWELWLNADETRMFLKMVEGERDGALHQISGCDSFEAYAKADGVYQGLCRIFDIVEEIKSMKEDE